MRSWHIVGRVSAVLMALSVYTATAMDDAERNAAIGALGERAAGYVEAQTEYEARVETAYIKRGAYRSSLVSALAYAGKLDEATAIATGTDRYPLREDCETIVLRAAMVLGQPDFAIGERVAKDIAMTPAQVVEKAIIQRPWREAQPYLDLIAKVPEGDERDKAMASFRTSVIIRGSYELMASLAQTIPADERANLYARHYELYDRNLDYQRFVDLAATVETPSFTLLTALSRAYVKLGKHADAVTAVDQAAGLLETIDEAEPVKQFQTIVAYVQQAGELEHVPPGLDAIVAQAIGAHGRIPATEKREYHDFLLGQMYGVQGRFDDAWALCEASESSARFAQFAHSLDLASKLGKRKEAAGWVADNSDGDDQRYLAMGAAVFRYYRDDVEEYPRRVATMRAPAERLIATYAKMKNQPEKRRDIVWNMTPFFEAAGGMVNTTGKALDPAINTKIWGLEILKELKLSLHEGDDFVFEAMAETFAVACVRSGGPDGAVAAAQLIAEGKEPKAAKQLYRRILATAADKPTEQAVLWALNYCGDMDMAMDLMHEFCYILAQSGKLQAAHAIAARIPPDRPDANIRLVLNGLVLTEAFARFGDVAKTQAVLTAIAPKATEIPEASRGAVNAKVGNTFTALGYHGVPLATVITCIDLLPNDDLKAAATMGAISGYGNRRLHSWHSVY